MAAPTFVSATTVAGVGAGLSTVTLILPEHQADDVAILAALNRADTVAALDATGWSSITSWSRGTFATYFLYGRRLTDPSALTYEVTRGDTTADFFARAGVFRSCRTDQDPWGVVGAVTTAEIEPFAVPGVSTTVPESLVLLTSLYEDDNTGSAAVTGTDPDLYTESYAESAVSNDASILLAYSVRTSAGATGDLTVNYNVALTVGLGAGALVLALEPTPPAASTQAAAWVNVMTVDPAWVDGDWVSPMEAT